MMRTLKMKTEDDSIAPATDKLKYDDDLKLSNESYETTLSSLFHSDPAKSKQEYIRNVAPYPQPYIFAQFAKLAYSDDLERRKGESDNDYKKRVRLPEGWSVLTMAKNTSYSNGYVGAVFLNGKDRQIMMAHRGTKPGIGSIMTDLKSIYGNNYGAQMNSACTFAHRISSSLKKMYRDGKPVFNVFFTGHSLGAWLSQITTLSLKYLMVVDKTFLKNPNMEDGMSAHTEIFESPGAKDMLIKIINDFDVRYSDTTISYDYLDITSYLSSPNQVNCCNSHVGILYRIYPVVNTDSGIFFAYTNASHGIDGILKTFDTQSGFFQKDELDNFKIKKVVDWPVTRGTIYSSSTEYDAFFQWAKLQNNFTPAEDGASFKQAVESAHGYVIRYQTKAYRDDKCSWNVFNRSEVTFLYTYQALRSLPEFYHPETLFEDDNDHYIESKLKEILMSKRSVFFQVPAHLRQLIPFVRILLKLYPELETRAKHDLSSVAARRKVYDIATNEYTDKIQPYVSVFQDGKFPEVQRFLQDSSQNVLHIAAENYTDFVMSRIIKNLGEDNEFDLKVFMELRNFMTIEKSFKLEEVLESEKVQKAIVVLDCRVDSQQEDSDATDLMKSFADFLKDSTKNYKIVLVSVEDNVFELTDNIRSIGSEKLRGRFLSIRNNGITWSDLTPKAKEDVLNDDSITYQGSKTKVSLNYLFNDKERSESYLDFLTIANIIKKVDLNIGQELLSNKDIEEFYVPRVFQQAILQVQLTLFQHLTPKTKIVITGVLPEELTKRRIDSSQVKIIQSRAEYLKLVQSGFDVHWLDYQDGMLNLKDTTDLDHLRQYLEIGPLKSYSEENVLGFFNLRQNVVLADIAGMGKTSVVTGLSRKFKEKKPSKWVIRINFSDCVRALKEAQNDEGSTKTQDWIVKFMTDKILPSNELTKLNTKLEKQIFQDSLLKYGNMVLFLDGFDEITPDFEEIALRMLHALRITKIDNIFVTSRRHTKEQLENTLNTMSVSLQPFSEDDQVQFLIHFWPKRLEPKGVSEVDLEEYAKKVVNFFKGTVEEDNMDLLGIPLHCRLAGEFMVDAVKSGDTTVLKGGLSLLQLYESFVMKKLEFYGKLNRPSEDTISSDNQRRIMRVLIRDVHYKYAMELLLSKETLNCLRLTQLGDLKELLDLEVLKAGLMVYGLKEPQFIHRTIAEYFLFNFASKFGERSNQVGDREQLVDLSREILLNYGLLVVRSFYDNFIVENKKMKTFIAPSESTKFVGPYLKFITANWSTNKKKCLNDNEETALQVALREGHEAISVSIMGLVEQATDLLDVKSFVNNRDLKNGLAALHYAVRYGFDDVATNLISLGALVNEETEETWSPLHFAAMYDETISALVLLKNGAKVDAVIKIFKYTPLHLAAQKGHYFMVKLLIEHEANVMARTVLEYTPLHEAAQGSGDVQLNVKVIQLLVENGAEINAVSVEGSTPLHISTNSGILDIVKALVDHGADINAKDNNDDSPMMTASFQETIIYLIQKGAEINVVNEVGDTIFHKAARYGYANVVRELLAKGADTGIKNKQGETPLDVAKKHGRENVVEILS